MLYRNTNKAFYNKLLTYKNLSFSDSFFNKRYLFHNYIIMIIMIIIILILFILDNEIDGVSLKLINPDSNEGKELLPNLASKIKFQEMIKIFEKKIDLTIENLSDEQAEQQINFEADNNEVNEEQEDQTDAGKEVKLELYRLI
jgi:hypothetical protein